MECETARPYTHVDHIGSGGLTLWNNKMKQWSMKKLCGPIKGLYAPPNLICFIAWFIGHDVILKRPTLLHHFQHVFFFFPPFKLKGWCSFRRIEIFSLSCISICVGGFSAMSFFFFFFIRSIWATLLNLSMITFLWKCCLYHCDIFLPTFCQYLVWEVAYYPLYPSFFSFPPSSFRTCNVPLSCIW